jgi:tRNA pseudouridine55 synthase
VTDDSGLLVVDKPQGWTSHQVVARARRLYGTRKVGHAGTLDPMATGVLVLGINRATRLLGHLALHDKAYSATIRLGIATGTDDAEGEPISQADASGLSDEQIAAAVAALTGDLQQVPSSVSAIKVNGQRAYARVRAGQEVHLAARPVTVSRFDILDTRRDDTLIDLDVEVECTTGTYVRALARDLGAALGVGGHLTALRRTRVGPYRLAETPLDLEGDEPTELMTMTAAARLSFPCLEVDEATAERVRHGSAMRMSLAELTAIVSPDDQLLALYQADAGGRARPLAVFV